jgi:hypothetical protein
MLLALMAGYRVHFTFLPENLGLIVGFLTLSYISVLVNTLKYSLPLSYTGPKILLYTLNGKWIKEFWAQYMKMLKNIGGY